MISSRKGTRSKEGRAVGAESDTVVITRVINAPREAVFRMWTDPAKAALWFGLPAGAVSEVCEIEPRSGGRLRVDSRNSDGSRYSMVGVVDEVIPPRLISFISESPLASFARTTLPDGSAAWRAVTRATFEEDGPGRTRVTVTVRVVLSAIDKKEDMVAGFKGGWSESLELLSAALGQRTALN